MSARVSAATPGGGLVQASAHGGADDAVPVGEAAGQASGEHGFGQGFLLFRDRGWHPDAAETDGAAVAVDIDGGAGDAPAADDAAQVFGGGGKAGLAAFGGVDPEQAYRLSPDLQGVAVDYPGRTGEAVADGRPGIGGSGIGGSGGGVCLACNGSGERQAEDYGDGGDDYGRGPGVARGLMLAGLALIGGVVMSILVAVMVARIALMAMAADDAGRGGGRGDVGRLSHDGASLADPVAGFERTSTATVRPQVTP